VTNNTRESDEDHQEHHLEAHAEYEQEHTVGAHAEDDSFEAGEEEEFLEAVEEQESLEVIEEEEFMEAGEEAEDIEADEEEDFIEAGKEETEENILEEEELLRDRHPVTNASRMKSAPQVAFDEDYDKDHFKDICERIEKVLDTMGSSGYFYKSQSQMRNPSAHCGLIQEGSVRKFIDFIDSARSGTLTTADILQAFPSSKALDDSSTTNVLYARIMEAVPLSEWLCSYVEAMKDVPRYVAK
jgi:hypothetical protein